MSTVERPVPDSEPAIPPGPEARALLARLTALCDGAAPIAGPLDGCDLAALAGDLGAAPAAVLWGRAGEGARRLSDAAASLAQSGIETCWAGLVRAEGDLMVDVPLVVAGGTCAGVVARALAAGPVSLALDAVEAEPGRRARVAIVSFEAVGPTRNGGVGTATTSLAQALAAAGHEVMLRFTGWSPPRGAERDRWRRAYAEFGVDLDALSTYAEGIDAPHFNHRRAYEAYRWLSAEHAREPFDVVHFPDCQGHGYYALEAKRLGLDFDGVTMVVGLHGPSRWVFESNRLGVDNVYRLADDHMERESIALADVALSPSAYMLGWLERNGWTLPERRYVHQYVLPASLRGAGEEPLALDLEGPGVDAARDLGIELERGPRPAAGGPREVVFFGRLEPRKGIETFCDALDVLARERPESELEVSFLGAATTVQGRHSADYVRDRAREWPWKARILTGRNQLQAVEYLRAPRRLAVIASPVDNSPNTVYEAISLGIRFVAARAGGIPELLDPADLERVTFAPEDAGALAEAMSTALGADRWEPARFAADPESTAGTIVDWHGRVAAARDGAGPPAPIPFRPARNGEPLVSAVIATEDFELVRPTLAALERQDLEGLETVLAVTSDAGDEVASALLDGLDGRFAGSGWRVVRGSRKREAAAVRADAAAAARGRWLWLTRPGAVAAPDLLSTLVACAERIDAELALVATTYPRTDGEEWRGHAPLAAALPSIAFSTTGPGGMLVRRDTLEALGGLEGRSVDAQHRCLLMRLLLDGRRAAVVPPALVTMLELPGEPFPDDLDRALARPLAERLPDDLADLASIVGQLTNHAYAPQAPVPDAISAYVQHLERQVEAVRRSTSWRVTRPLRLAAERARRRSEPR